MRRNRLTSLALGAAWLTLGVTAHAQERGRNQDSTFVDLRRDGNAVAALQTIIGTGFVDLPVGTALRTIAANARLNLTFDPQLNGLGTKTSIPPRERSVAVALLELAEAGHLRIRVSRSGQLVVLPDAPLTAEHPAVADTVQRAPISLPAVRTQATRSERQSFEAETNVGSVSITGRELRSSPTFIEPDLLRSVQLLPGIEARSDYAAGFNVRGGESDQSLILIDGFPIYNPFHLGGLFSTFIDATVGNVALHKGGLAARYGGRLSGVLDVQSAEPASADLHGTADVSLVSSSASVGRTFADGEGSWLVAARRTYADAVVNLIKPDAFPYHFQDVQGHITRTLGRGLRLSITAYNGLDAASGTNGDVAGGSWGNSVLGVTLSKRFDNHPRIFGLSLGDSATIEQRASTTRFSAHVDVANDLFHAVNSVTELRAAGSITAHRANASQTLGYEVAEQRMSYVATSPFRSYGDFIPFDSLRQQPRSAAIFGDQLWHPTSSLLVDAGLRLETVPSADWTGVSPRVSMKYFVGKNTAITAAAGTYAQWMHSLGREEEPVQPLQFWVASDSATPVSQARDVILGMERWMTPLRLFHIEGFYKRYEHLLVPNMFSDPRTPGDEFLPAQGSSYGIDVLLRQLDGGPFSGWLAYTYAVNSRVGPDGVRYFPSQDRRHNLNLVGSWHLGGATLGARANLASGIPTTPIVGGFARERYDPVTHRWIGETGLPSEQSIPGSLNSARLPWYSRVDVSVNRTARLSGVSVLPYLSIVNVFNSHNPAAYIYSFTGRPDRSSFPNLPFVPTFGVSVAY